MPDISFVETNPETILAETILNYENAYFESTGIRKSLQPGDPIRIFLYTQALREIQLRHVIDETAKQNLLKYAIGPNLDHLGARVRTSRGKAKATSTKMLLKFSQAQSTITYIPKGIRFSPGSNYYFETTIINELAAGQQEIVVDVIASVAGSEGNGLLPGQINVIVDPQPFLVEAYNTEVTQGGEDIEDDESYRQRIYLAPEGLSVAGPGAAYEYHALKYSQLIEDVHVSNPSDGVVDIRVILEDGELPSGSFLEGMTNYFGKGIRPLTDKVTIGAPNIIYYNTDVTYYLTSSENIEEQKSKVQTAYDEFIKWQKAKIGRDINPSELIFKLRLAGAKRVDVISPLYLATEDNEIAQVGTSSLVFGGVESE